MIAQTSTSPVSNDSLQDAEQRAWRYWFGDGLATLVAGLTCLLISGFLLLDRHNGSNRLSVILGFTFILAYCAALFRQRQIVEWLKSKITYPRTGYVQPPYFAEDQSLPLDLTVLSMGGADTPRVKEWRRAHQDRKRRAVLMVSLMAAAILAMLVIRNTWVCALTGFAMSAGLWIGARKDQRLTWIVLAGFPFLGMYMTIFVVGKLAGPEHLTFFLIGAGLLFVLEGTESLLRYLRENPRPGASSL